MRLLGVISLAFLQMTPGGVIAAEEPPWPMPGWPTARPSDLGVNETRLEQARDYARTGGGSGMIVVRGKVVMTWGDQKAMYDLKSTTKSIGITALGLAIKDGKMRLADKALRHHPNLGVPPESNRQTG
jgi:CubicO group peptidase (beta-lactamase class C family)